MQRLLLFGSCLTFYLKGKAAHSVDPMFSLYNIYLSVIIRRLEPANLFVPDFVKPLCAMFFLPIHVKSKPLRSVSKNESGSYVI